MESLSRGSMRGPCFHPAAEGVICCHRFRPVFPITPFPECCWFDSGQERPCFCSLAESRLVWSVLLLLTYRGSLLILSPSDIYGAISALIAELTL